MLTKEARDIGERIRDCLQERKLSKAQSLLAPVLNRRTPFPKLRLIGAAVGSGPQDLVYSFLDQVAETKAMGGWVVIASALQKQFNHDFLGVYKRCHRYIIAADVWYAADTLGEGIPGQGFVDKFEGSLLALHSWRWDENPWIWRAVGTGIHFWAKRSQGLPEMHPQVEQLLHFLEPLYAEVDMQAAKGVGWGLKTMGKYYPAVLEGWLVKQIRSHGRPHRAIVLRKAMTYLSIEAKQSIQAEMH